MRILTAFVSAVILTACPVFSQEMSAEWYRQKDLSWQRTRAEFPESRYDGAFKKRLLEIDQWAKENNPQLYYNPEKPYLLAQMVQREIDLVAEQQAARERLRAEASRRAEAAQQQAAILQQAARAEAEGANRKQSPSSPAPIRISKQGATQDPTSNNSERGGITGSSLATIWLGIAIIIIITFGVAWALHRIIRPRSGIMTAAALGRKWAAWIVAIATISLLPSFLRTSDGNSLARWVLVVPVFGTTAFVLGWVVGLFKYKKVGGHVDSQPPLMQRPPETSNLLRLTPTARPSATTATPPETSNLLRRTPTPPSQPRPVDASAENNAEKLTDDFQTSPDEPQINSIRPIMKNTEFEVVIPEGKELGDGYVEMRHNTQYSLNLKNHRHVPCDAEVTIDGNHVGTWRINPCNEIRIERPVHDTGHFTFFEVGTDEAGMAGIAKKADNGLVSVTFKPKIEYMPLRAAGLPRTEFSAGATGLTGESKQRFIDATNIEHDMSRAFTIHLRLVARRPDIRPLAPRSTPVPPPVDCSRRD